MHTKEDILPQLEYEFDRWDNLLANLSDKRIVDRQLPSDLSIKDVIAHLWAWQQLSIARLDAALHNRAPIFQYGPEALNPELAGNLDRINAWIFASNLDRS